MMHQIPTLGLCFTLLCVLSFLGTTKGTYMPVHCCTGSTPYGSRCVCNPGVHPDRYHNCIEPCWNRCGANADCNKYTFKCFCKSGFVGDPGKGCTRPVSTFQFARSSYTVNENAGFAKLQIDRISGVSGRVTLSWKSLSISATLNSDYKGASGTITFESNEKWKSIQIPIVNDQIFENTETFKVILTSASSGGRLGPRRLTVVSIRDDDLPAKFQFARSSYVVNENVGSVKLQIDRISGGLNKVTLYWKSTGITATLNSDYKGASGSITFGVGEKWKSIVIPIVNDQVYEQTETFKVTLTSASSGGVLGPRRETVVSIRDDDPRSKFQFARSSYLVNEDAGSVKLQIDRISGALNAVTLYWKSTGITATLNSDYKGASGSITFGVGEKWKSIIIPIVNDQIFENTETFKVTLTSASAGGELGPRRETVVTIKDNDPPSKFQFARSSYAVGESAGVVKLQVDRISGGLQKVTLYWKSTGITATLNSDYQGASGSVTFGVGEKWKLIQIPIVNDKIFEQIETFKVTLTSASAGGAIGPRSTTVVTIKDDDLPCEGKCKNFAYSYCNPKTNRCVCKPNYYGDPYNGGCRCGGGGGGY